jgi:hypothetical protein
MEWTGIYFSAASFQLVVLHGVEFSTQLARKGQKLSESGFTGLNDWQDWAFCSS